MPQFARGHVHVYVDDQFVSTLTTYMYIVHRETV